MSGPAQAVNERFESLHKTVRESYGGVIIHRISVTAFLRQPTTVKAKAQVGVIGSEVIALKPPKSSIKAIVVDPNYRSGGLGSALVAAVETEMKSYGIRSVTVVLPLEEAESFWAANGYTLSNDGTLAIKKL
jgi:GNAT superfamily N-acetyltransferase